MAYTKSQTITSIKDALKDIDSLYNASCINQKGTTSATGELYTEVCAEEILKNLKDLLSIKTVTRKKSYCQPNHFNVSFNFCDSNRQEEIFAKRITGLTLDELGLISDYQIPLKDTNEDKGLGKIDLLSFNEETKTLYLIEIKYKNNYETLLRATLESYTYFKTVDKRKLISDYLHCLKDCSNTDKFISNNIDPDEIKVVPAVLLVPECNASKELDELDCGKRPKLKALALALDIKYFTLEFWVNETTL